MRINKITAVLGVSVSLLAGVAVAESQDTKLHHPAARIAATPSGTGPQASLQIAATPSGTGPQASLQIAATPSGTGPQLLIRIA